MVVISRHACTALPVDIAQDKCTSFASRSLEFLFGKHVWLNLTWVSIRWVLHHVSILGIHSIEMHHLDGFAIHLWSQHRVIARAVLFRPDRHPLRLQQTRQEWAHVDATGDEGHNRVGFVLIICHFRLPFFLDEEVVGPCAGRKKNYKIYKNLLWGRVQAERRRRRSACRAVCMPNSCPFMPFVCECQGWS